MTDVLVHFEQLLIPLIMSNIVHMLVVKKDLFKGLNIPIWEKGFGKNKTWRGIIALMILNAFFEIVCVNIFGIEIEYPALLGAILGLTYAISELPNSFVKRKLGIAPGSGGGNSKYKYLFYVIDKSDSAIGVTIVYVLIRSLTLKIGVILFVVNSLAHTIVAIILVQLKIKSSF